MLMLLHPTHGGFVSVTRPRPPRLHTCLTNSSSNNSHRQPSLSETLQDETLKALEWSSVCNQVAAFASTAPASGAARSNGLALGRSPAESRRLLDQTTAATLFPTPLDFSGIQDVSEIVSSSVSGQLGTVNELCAVKRTLAAARRVLEQLEEVASEGQSLERYSPLLEILRNCNFKMELEGKIGFCIDCSVSTIRDRASEDLEIIRSERKRNIDNLDSLLKRVSTEIFQAGGVDRPLITNRRSRMCVGVRASHRSLIPHGIVLNLSSSGLTYFIEPEEAVELNNMEVRLSDAERAEELVILSLLTSEIAKSETEIKYLLDRVIEVDLAFARAAHAQWMNGVRPVLCSEDCGCTEHHGVNSLLVDVEGVQHPLLLESSLRIFSDSGNSGRDTVKGSSVSKFPVPIDFKIECRTKVIVISGPNTGGKTASMKTLGVAALMLKAGMYVPAKHCPKIPWFDLILADIGDHQSLEQNLSTFSGHISRIVKISEVASKESLVLIDEIGTGTDPSEGIALSASILQYLKDKIRLAVVTTHYMDLTRLKEEDARFQNAAMGFSQETLQPTYQILWGSTGDSNALNIAEVVGFDKNIIQRAKTWLEKLMPDKQEKRQNSVYESLMQERNKLETQATEAAALLSEIMNLHREILDEAKDLDEREVALKAKETQRIQREIKAAKYQIESVAREFESQLKTASPDQFNSLAQKAESVIASIVEAHSPADSSMLKEPESNSYAVQVGERVRVKGLGDKSVATVVETQEDNDIVLVQYGKMKIRVNKKNVRALASTQMSAAKKPKLQVYQQSKKIRDSLEVNEFEPAYGPVVQTSKNTVDLRGMRKEEAAIELNIAISGEQPSSVIFVIHGMGTGVVKECAYEVLRNHPRVAKFEQESPMNAGCKIVYIK